MAHPDNLSPIERGIAQTELLYRECFRMADRLVMGDGGAQDFASTEAREKSQALIPLIALDIKQSVQQLINIHRAPQRDVDEAQDSGDTIIAALKKRNDRAVGPV
jgi:hypothetical protein